MSNADRLASWIGAYRRAWNSNDPAEIADLFTTDAEYFTEPFHPPWRGREQIVTEWVAHKDEPGDTEFDWQPVSITDEVSVVQGTTKYADRTYSNLWVIRLDDAGRCRHFTEWWMEHS